MVIELLIPFRTQNLSAIVVAAVVSVKSVQDLSEVFSVFIFNLPTLAP